MMTQEPRKVYMSDEYWERAKRLAKSSGMSVSAYIRALLDLKIPRPLPPDEYKLIYRELSAIGNNINQMARLSHHKGSAEYINFAEAVNVIYDLRKRIMNISVLPEDMKDGIYSNNTGQR